MGEQVYHDNNRCEYLHQQVYDITVGQCQLFRTQNRPGLRYDLTAEQYDNGQNTGCDTYSQINAHS